jgi:hypothetical protein
MCRPWKVNTVLLVVLPGGILLSVILYLSFLIKKGYGS